MVDGRWLSTPALVVHRCRWCWLLSCRREREAARVHCCYDYDEATGLVALTITEATGYQWTAVMDLDELYRVADAVTASGWVEPEWPLRARDLRRVVRAVTGRDPGV